MTPFRDDAVATVRESDSFQPALVDSSCLAVEGRQRWCTCDPRDAGEPASMWWNAASSRLQGGSVRKWLPIVFLLAVVVLAGVWFLSSQSSQPDVADRTRAGETAPPAPTGLVASPAAGA